MRHLSSFRDLFFKELQDWSNSWKEIQCIIAAAVWTTGRAFGPKRTVPFMS